MAGAGRVPELDPYHVKISLTSSNTIRNASLRVCGFALPIPHNKGFHAFDACVCGLPHPGGAHTAPRLVGFLTVDCKVDYKVDLDLSSRPGHSVRRAARCKDFQLTA